MSMKQTVKRTVRRVVSALPPPRDQAALRAARAVRDLVTGKAPQPVTRGKPARKAPVKAVPKPYGLVPGPALAKVERVPDDAPWQAPPVSAKEGQARSIYRTGSKPLRYDVALLEELNEEYRAKPVVPAPRQWTSEALGAGARNHILWAHHMVDLKDKKVLEVGCGNGYEVWSMAHNLGSDAYGVDVIQPNCWEDLVGERVNLQCVDLAVHNPFERDSFDRVISFTVWEHVVHPHKLLKETYDILRPGGLNWLRANLWAGPLASHRYRDIYFPWPHLLFSDDVIAEWDEKHGRAPEGSAWVNKLSWNHYERYIHDIGYRLRSLSFDGAQWDQEFYERFEDVLGRVPITDLQRDFFTAVLEKPADGAPG